MTNMKRANDTLPGVYYDEDVTYESTGVGSKIPIFIGKTGNSVTASDKYKTDGSQVLRFTNKSKALREIRKTGDDWEDYTGIGTYYDDDGEPITGSTNLLAKAIYEFYEEARLLQSTDIGVPYIYVIDLGDATSWDDWNRALDTAKSLYDAQVEVYVGIEGIKKGNDSKAPSVFLSACSDKIFEETKYLDLRYGYATIGYADTTDNYKTSVNNDGNDDSLDEVTLVGLSKSLRNIHSNTDSIKKLSRVGIVEPLLFGKHIARICCTPFDIEPGYYTYRSVTKNTFHKRNKSQMQLLQKNGIIFGRDEHINGKVYPKMNLCVSVAFGNDNGRPSDSLFHARFLADDLLREVFEACYSQIKANESSTNLAYLQTRINKIVNDRVSSELMIRYNEKTEAGTRLLVKESEDDPYTLIVYGQIQPQKVTIAIEVQGTVKL